MRRMTGDVVKLGVVVNEAAGGGRCGRRVGPVLEQLAGQHTLDVRRTAGPGDATELARKLSEDGVDAIVSIGGDGTLFEVVNGLMGVDAPPPFALMPLGTGNSFGRDFGVIDVDTAMAALQRAQPRRVDVVRVVHAEGELHYINLLSVGFAAEVGALTNRRFKPLGALGYVMSVLVQVTRLSSRAFPHEAGEGLDDGAVTLLSFSNSQCTGGEMRMAPTADATDGLVDLVRIGAMGRRRLLTCFPKLFQGTHIEMEEVTVRKVARVSFPDGPLLDVMLDGEMRPLRLSSLEVLPGALELLA
jgi:diacylglycerol kinase (ATP)